MKGKKKRVLFIDRDGVIVEECQVDSLEKMRFIPHVMQALCEIRQKTDFEFVMVSNQDGVNTPSFPLDDFLIPHQRILDTLRGEDVVFDDIRIDYSLPEDGCPGRKPSTAMLQDYMNGDWDLEHSFMIGDRETDMKLADNLGAKGIWLHDEKSGRENVALETDSWLEIAAFLTCGDVKAHRKAHVERITKETSIILDIDIDGTGEGDVSTGIGFFDHMLAQVVRHSMFNIDAQVTGDLWIDVHHSVEDSALALGKAVRDALGDKRGINRYGFELLCMDDVHSEVSIDFSGRPELVFDVNFTRQDIGTFPTEMIRHFFKSFCDAAGCNLYMSVSEGNSHHQAEALFKAFARAMRTAVKRIPGSSSVVSTKGVLE